MGFETFTFLLILNGFPSRRLFDGHYERHHDPRAVARAHGTALRHRPHAFGVHLHRKFELGYLTPMGLNLFVSSSIFNQSLGQVIRPSFPLR